jgi:hypothetical protein
MLDTLYWYCEPTSSSGLYKNAQPPAARAAKSKLVEKWGGFEQIWYFDEMWEWIDRHAEATHDKECEHHPLKIWCRTTKFGTF